MSIYHNLMLFANNETLIQKGQKLFLDGKVLPSKNELIPHWHTYGVKDYEKINEVVAPTIHLLNANYNSEEYFKLSHCNCEYYHMTNFCHHIIAVLAHLDNKYKSVDVTTKVSDSLWNSLMLGEKSTVLNQYKYNLQNYFEFSWDERDIIKNLGSLSKDIVKYTELKDMLTDVLHTNITDFTKEMKIIDLFAHNYLSSQNSAIWFRIFLPYLKKTHSLNKEHLGIKTFLNIYSNIFTIDAHTDIIKYLKNFDSDVKHEISKYFITHYKKQPKIWQSFALQSQDQKTLIDNLDTFDIKVMLQIANICPHEQDLIENKVFNLMKEWSNFLYTTDYTDILNVVEKWYLIYGKTDLFIEAIDYITTNHSKKKTLIKELQGY